MGIQLLLFEMEVLFGLGELPSNGVDHDFLFFHDGQERRLLAKGSLDFVRLSLAFELELAEVVLKALDLEPELIVFRLVHSPVISLLFDILGVLNQQFVLLDLERISLLSEVESFLLCLAISPLDIIQVSSELP